MSDLVPSNLLISTVIPLHSPDGFTHSSSSCTNYFFFFFLCLLCGQTMTQLIGLDRNGYCCRVANLSFLPLLFFFFQMTTPSSTMESCSSHGKGISSRRRRTSFRIALFLSILNVLLSFTIAGPVFSRNYQVAHQSEYPKNNRLCGWNYILGHS